MIEDLFKMKEISNFITTYKLNVSTDYVLSYWRKKKWKTSKGNYVKTLSSAVNVANSSFLTYMRKEKGLPTYNLKDFKKMEKEKQKLLDSKFTTYNNQLKDERWISFRNFVLNTRGRMCEKCGSVENLQIHHPFYLNGRAAWEYTCLDVIVLCGKCHRHEHNL